ncbi:MAG: L-seryl-tRNA(Sec) selenium transferase [Planctomycetota bacterium]|nr:L-seryl-tRNA(Sec) selenium transferase [Planctomycetota bacterium]
MSFSATFFGEAEASLASILGGRMAALCYLPYNGWQSLIRRNGAGIIMSDSPLRHIPSVNELLENPLIRQLTERFSHRLVVGRVRSFLDGLRDDFQSAAAEIRIPTPTDLARKIADWIIVDQQPGLRPVINGTGTLLHTGLGRAPLSEVALQEMVQVARGYCSLEIDLRSGERSRRSAHVERQLIDLTGAEAALVVNNNAAATVLALSALAAGQEVIVSRGQLVEIGGSYRLPEVMNASGCHLREVGTTNRTCSEDYEKAITDQTRVLLRVHPSNYAVVGFTESVDIRTMARIAHDRGLVAVDDIGSGVLLASDELRAPGEPVARESIAAGADLVLFSGDKLLGGPQCGIIVGRKQYVEMLARQPLSRALRVGKLTLAALAATLRLYQKPDELSQHLPLWGLLSTKLENIKHRADRLAPQIASSRVVRSAEVVADKSPVGGGSLPNEDVPTWCVAIEPRDERCDQLAQRLRLSDPSLMTRVAQDRVRLDLRTVFPHQDMEISQLFAGLSEANVRSTDPAP